MNSILRIASLWLALVYGIGATLPSQAFAQDTASSSSYAQLGFTQIERIQDVLSTWTPDRHLYVKGDIGASRQQLADLEQWLAENGPHWTVVLLDTADSEYYVAADGRSLF
ncbi:MAG: hypothetical protein ACKN82_11330, partial [Pirellula sp.]